MSVAERLVELRKARGFTQRQVWEGIGMSPLGYQRYEYGEREPVYQKLIALADFYNVSLDCLVGREVPKTPLLSDEQIDILKGFDSLNSAGRNLLFGVLDSLRVTHAASV